MRTTFTKKPLGLAMACALALGVLSGTASAQVQQDEKALVTDSRGAPVMSGYGLCVRSGFGPTPAWTQGCHAHVPQPTTFSGECKDANNAKNIACMQPDRHVFIEVSGTRIAK